MQDTTTLMCSPGSTPSATAVGTGILDLETSTPPAAYPAYLAYPLVQSTLPIQAAMPGAVEPNTVYIEGVRGKLIPPPGLTMTWPDGCPGDFYWPTTTALLPGTMVGLTAQVISPCQAAAIHDLFVAGTLPPDLGQLVMFTIEMRVVGQLSSGSEIDSDKFRFSVRTCIGCLQTALRGGIAQYNFPARPSCSASAQAQPRHGQPLQHRAGLRPGALLHGEHERDRLSRAGYVSAGRGGPLPAGPSQRRSREGADPSPRAPPSASRKVSRRGGAAPPELE